MLILDRFIERLETSKSLDALAIPLGNVFDRLLGNVHLKAVLSGKQIGHPLHPVLVALPIGAFTSATMMDWSSKTNRRIAADDLIAIGIATAMPTAVAGISDWRYTTGAERRVGLVHASTNLVAISLYSASLLFRRRGNVASGKVLALLGGTMLAGGGYLGGHLSYAMGVGVDTNAFGGGPTNWTRVARETDITEDRAHVVEAYGMKILMTRVQGEIVAISNRCSHRGGPLSEGTQSGNCVKCPWHDSVFDLRDGEVVQGPAVRPQTRFDVRVRSGTVEIRHINAHVDLQADIDLSTLVPDLRT